MPDVMVFTDNESTNLYVFVIGANNHLHVRFFKATETRWQPWIDLGQPDPTLPIEQGARAIWSVETGRNGSAGILAARVFPGKWSFRVHMGSPWVAVASLGQPSMQLGPVRYLLDAPEAVGIKHLWVTTISSLL